MYTIIDLTLTLGMFYHLPRKGEDNMTQRNGEPPSEKESALPKPKTSHDPDWAEKIERAKEARGAGKQAREGKSPVFRTR